MLSTDRPTDRQTERPTGLTGCPSIDKPWLKYYADGKHIDLNPNCGMYAFLRHCSEGRLEYTALNYFGRKISYQSLFNNIDQIACALQAVGIKKGDIVNHNLPEDHPYYTPDLRTAHDLYEYLVWEMNNNE